MTDALSFCDVTILTVGFGDIVPPNDAGRGIVFPFSVGGIIVLGLVISSIRRFAQEIGSTKVIQRHAEHRRAKTFSHAVTNSFEAHEKAVELHQLHKGQQPVISAPFDVHARTIVFDPDIEKADTLKSPSSLTSTAQAVKSPLWSPVSWKSTTSTRTTRTESSQVTKQLHRLRHRTSRKLKILILRQEKDRFEAMRAIQAGTHKFKKYLALTMSIIACTSQSCCRLVHCTG